MTRVATMLAGALLVAGSVTGCGAGQQVAARPMTFQLDAGRAGAVTVDVPRQPIATAPTSTEDVSFELYALQRSDSFVQVVFALHNTGDAEMNLAFVASDLDENPAVSIHVASAVALVDGTGLKEYKTYLEDGEDGACMCSVTWDAVSTSGFKPGTRRYYVAEVAAPPAGVSDVTVRAGGVASVDHARIEG